MSRDPRSGETARFKEPSACSEQELAEFARLVRQGFAGSDAGLPGRIAAARWLAFHRAADGALTAIAGLKAPSARYRKAVFERAAAGSDWSDHELELGWVFVVPAQRGQRIAADLCRQLLAGVPDAAVFATTRPDNGPMISILAALGFARAGRPYRHLRRDEDLVLFLRPAPRS